MSDVYQIKDQHAIHFLTFQVVGWADVFSRKDYRDIIIESLDYCRKQKGLEVFAYVIMTNHVHLICRSKNEKLSSIVRDFKKFTSKKIMQDISRNPQESRKQWLEMIFKFHAKYNKRPSEKQFWTHENHAIQLDSDSKFKSRLNYIHKNPVRTGWVENPEDYLYSSARNFAELDYLLQIDEI